MKYKITLEVIVDSVDFGHMESANDAKDYVIEELLCTDIADIITVVKAEEIPN